MSLRGLILRGFGAGGLPTTPTLTVADNADGTGGVVTVSGGDAQTLNQIQYQLFPDGQVMSGPNFTGNGSASLVVPPGYYLVWDQASLNGGMTVSRHVYVGLTAGNESLHEQLQAGALARIQSLALPGIAEVRRIKLPEENRLTNLSLPCCLLMTWKQSEDYPEEDGSNAYDDTAFPIYVAFLSGDLNDDVTDAQVTKWRQLVRRAFRGGQRLATTGARHYKTTFGPGPVVDVAMTGTSIQASTLLMKLICREPRGLGV